MMKLTVGQQSGDDSAHNIDARQWSKRGLESAGGDDNGPITKRRKVASSLLLGHVPQDCLLSILQFLSLEDLASVAVTCRQLSQVCSHQSLPQSRAATLVCRTPFLATLLLRLRSQEERGVFRNHNNRTHLKLVGCHKLENMKQREIEFFNSGLGIPEVTSLEFCVASTASLRERQIRTAVPTALAPILPNLRELNLNRVRIPKSGLSDFCVKCPALEKIQWDSHSNTVAATGEELAKCGKLRELRMDNAVFCVADEAMEKKLFEDVGSSSVGLFSLCNYKLERVSLQGAFYCLSNKPMTTRKPFSQEGLMKFVRATKSLRWFRSDLSRESIDILKQERPEVTFLSSFPNYSSSMKKPLLL